MNFAVFVAICESFLREIWGVAFIGAAQANNPRKFSPSKVSHYTYGTCRTTKQGIGIVCNLCWSDVKCLLRWTEGGKITTCSLLFQCLTGNGELG